MNTITSNDTNKDLAAIQLNQVIEQLKQYATSDLIEIYNDYADMNRYERIYDNDEDTINTLFDRAWTAISLSNHDGYRDNDDYFTYNGYGLMSSFNYLSDDNNPIDISELAQWLINEDKLVDYDITVVTLDDMLASIEDNITDDSELLNTAINYLGVSTMIKGDDKVVDYNQYLIDNVIDEIRYTDYETIKSVIDRLGINYQ